MRNIYVTATGKVSDYSKHEKKRNLPLDREINLGSIIIRESKWETGPIIGPNQ